MRLDEVRRLYNIEDLVPGLRGSSTSRWAVCPLPQHHHSSRPDPSFSVYWSTYKCERRQYFKCHGNCGLYGNVIDLAGYMWVPGYRKYDINLARMAASILTGGKCQINPPIAPPPVPELPNWLVEDLLPPSMAVIEYAIKRGISQEMIEKHRIGTPKAWMKDDPYNIHYPEMWMAIPTIHHETLMGVKLRNITDRGIRYMAVPGSKKGLWNHNEVWMKTGVTLITKGEIAGIVLASHGFRACAPTAGEGGDVSEIVQALCLSENIVIGDNDTKGIEAAHKRAALFSASLNFPPGGYKDVDTFILQDQDALETIQRWEAQCL